ncbi:hypothetical protein BH11PLA2_BH11PLA2_50020 [soil metagenome]
MVVQIGTAAATPSGTGTLVFLKQFQAGVAGQGSPVAFAQFPSGAGGSRLVLTTSNPTDGYLTNSVDRSNAVLAGYDAASGTASVSGTANRVVGFAQMTAPNGLTGGLSIQNSTSQASAYSNGTINSAVALGDPGGTLTPTWTGGFGSTTTGGVRLINNNTLITSTATAVNSVDIYNNQLFASSSSGTSGIYSVGSGTPQGVGNTMTLLINTGSSAPNEFIARFDSRVTSANLPANAAGNNVFYVADSQTNGNGGIQRWAWNGTVWNNDYTIAVGGAFGVRGLAGRRDPITDNTVLFASRSDGLELLQFTDVGSDLASEATKILLATPTNNTVFRGVALAVIPEPTMGLIVVAGLFALRRYRL